jgi:hypothetical protein
MYNIQYIYTYLIICIMHITLLSENINHCGPTEGRIAALVCRCQSFSGLDQARNHGKVCRSVGKYTYIHTYIHV